MPKKQICLFIIILQLFVIPNAVAQTFNPYGPLMPTTADDFWPKTLSGPNFNEFWNYHFYLNNGMKVHITFSVVNFGSFKSPVSGARISILNLEGQTYQVSREYPIERLVIDKDRFRMQLHPEREVFVEGRLPAQHRVRVFTRKDNVQYDIDLVFSDIQPGVAWGDALYGIRSEKIGIMTMIPHARVRGHVAVDDVRAEVRGTAYMDHTWQHQSSVRMIHSAYKFVHHTDGDNWDILYFMLPERRGEMATIGHRIVNENGRIKHFGVNKISRFSTSRIDGKDVGNEMDLVLSSGDTVRLLRRRDQEVHTTFGELGWLARRAVRSFLGGELVDFRGDGVLREGNREIRGHYNFVIID